MLIEDFEREGILREREAKRIRDEQVCVGMKGEGMGLKLAFTDVVLAVLETIKVTRQIMKGWICIGKFLEAVNFVEFKW